MRIAIITIILYAGGIHAQWGTGLSGAGYCPQGYGPGRGAVNGNDEISNLNGQRNRAQSVIDRKKQQLSRTDQYLDRANQRMKQVLSTEQIRAIELHHRYGYNASSYQAACGSGGRAGGGGNENGPNSTLIERIKKRANGASADAANTSLVRPPPAYCVRTPRGTENLWAEFVEDNGRVSEEVCDYKSNFSNLADTAPASACREGLREYYERLDEKKRLQGEIAQIQSDLDRMERRREQIADQIAEGTYCPSGNCGAGGRGYYNNGPSSTDAILGLAAVGLVAGIGIMNASQNRGYRPGYPPYPMPRPGMPPGAYPGRPYPAPMPGYMGGFPPGRYGAIPGAMGPGGFAGCTGANPVAVGNPYMAGYPQHNAFPMGPGLGPNPFVNPYASGYPPGAMPYPGGGYPPYGPGGVPWAGGAPGVLPFPGGHPALMPGFGPGFAPMVGNGLYDPYGTGVGYPPGAMPYAGGYPPYGLGGYPPGVLPFPGGGYPPYGPGGYPPGVLPFPGGGYPPYGAGGYPPGVLPFPGGGYPPYGVGNGYFSGAYPGIGGGGYPPPVLPYLGGGGPLGGPGYGGGYYPQPMPYGNPVGNLYSQVQMLNYNTRAIQSGYGYGGGYMPPPPVLPYLGSPYPTTYPSPIYNQPRPPGAPVPRPPTVPPAFPR